jgi:hypothetical protein
MRQTRRPIPPHAEKSPTKAESRVTNQEDLIILYLLLALFLFSSDDLGSHSDVT